MSVKAKAARNVKGELIEIIEKEHAEQAAKIDSLTRQVKSLEAEKLAFVTKVDILERDLENQRFKNEELQKIVERHNECPSLLDLVLKQQKETASARDKAFAERDNLRKEIVILQQQKGQTTSASSAIVSALSTPVSGPSPARPVLRPVSRVALAIRSEKRKIDSGIVAAELKKTKTIHETTSKAQVFRSMNESLRLLQLRAFVEEEVPSLAREGLRPRRHAEDRVPYRGTIDQVCVLEEILIEL